MNSRNNMRLLPVVALLIALAGGLALNAKQSSKWDELARKRKADYLYLESQNQENLDNVDASFDLLQESFFLNPDDKAVGFDYGASLLRTSQYDSLTLVRSLALMADYFQDNPSDLQAGGVYGSIADLLTMKRTGMDVWEKLHHYHPDNSQVTYNLIKDLVAVGDSLDMQRAIELYDTLYMAEGEDPGIFIDKMKLLYYLDDTTRMLTEVEQLLSKPGGANKTNFLLAGEVYEAIDDNSLALEYFKKAQAADTTDGNVSYRLANFYLNSGDSASYDREIINTIMSPTTEVEMKTELLRDYVSTHLYDSLNYGKIDTVVHRVVEMHPHEGSLRNLYFGFLLIDNRPDEAIEQLRYFLDANPDKLDQWMLLFRAYNDKDDNAGAEKVLTDALRYFPEEQTLYYLRGGQRSLLEDYEGAIDDYNTAINLDKGEDSSMLSSVYCWLGDMLCRVERYDEGYAAYDKSLELNHDNSYTLNNYAYSLAVNQQRLEDALAMAEKSRRLDPENLNNLDTHAWVLFQMKNYQKAREVFDSAIEELLLDPTTTYEAYEHAGDIYFMTGDADKAVDFWEMALKMNPDDPLLKKKVEHKTYFFK